MVAKNVTGSAARQIRICGKKAARWTSAMEIAELPKAMVVEMT
jgi:hypothetical protein